MSDLRIAAQQALEALENTSPLGFNMESDKKFFAARTALRAALAQQEEPQTIDEAMRLPRALAQAYEAGYNAGVAHEREACAKVCGQYELARSAVAAIRARNNP